MPSGRGHKNDDDVDDTIHNARTKKKELKKIKCNENKYKGLKRINRLKAMVFMQYLSPIPCSRGSSSNMSTAGM